MGRFIGCAWLTLACVVWLSGACVSADPASHQPLISEFSPASGYAGTLVTISGSNLVEVSAIEFNGVSAPVLGGDDLGTIVGTQVPAGASTGPISVTTSFGTATSAVAFEVPEAGPPVVTGFSPRSGQAGAEVTFQGTNLVDVTSVLFNGLEARFSTFAGLVAFVPTNATTGPITVATRRGSFTTTTAFEVTATGAPFISSFSPTSGPPGTVVTLAGARLAGIVSLDFNGVPAQFTDYGSAQDPRPAAQVPDGATTGPITIVTHGGRYTTADSFTVTAFPPPVIDNFSPSAAQPMATITISGRNFVGVQSVQVSGVEAEFESILDTLLSVRVPYAPSGLITVVTASGGATSSVPFTVLGGAPAPEVLTFAPASGPSGTAVSLTTTNLGRVRSVAFDGIEAVFTTVSNRLVAWVPPSARPGAITVRSTAGVCSSKEPFDAFNSGDLFLASTSSTDTIGWGQRARFSLVLTNLSGNSLEDLVLTNHFAFGPAAKGELVVWSGAGPEFGMLDQGGLSVTGVRVSQGTYRLEDRAVLCDLGRLEPGASATLEIEVEPGTADVLHHLAAAFGRRPDGSQAYGTFLESVVVLGPLTLTAHRFGHDQLEISWPLSGSAVVLQSASSPLRSANWTDVNLPVASFTSSSGRNSARVRLGSGPEFYRLRLAQP